MLDRMWELRANLSGDDAGYVAAADHRLAATPDLRCPVTLP